MDGLGPGMLHSGPAGPWTALVQVSPKVPISKTLIINPWTVHLSHHCEHIALMGTLAKTDLKSNLDEFRINKTSLTIKISQSVNIDRWLLTSTFICVMVKGISQVSVRLVQPKTAIIDCTLLGQVRLWFRSGQLWPEPDRGHKSSVELGIVIGSRSGWIGPDQA